MGKVKFKAIVRGRANACHAFVGALSPKCVVVHIESESLGADGCSILVSGTANSMLMISGGSPTDRSPSDIPSEIGRATAFGCSRYGQLIVSIQTLSAELDIDVLVTQLDESREQAREPDVYVHYMSGERIDDKCPKEIVMSSGRRRWFRR